LSGNGSEGAAPAAAASELEPGRIRALLPPDAFGRPYVFRATAGSTNDEARGLAAAGAPEGAVVVADAQTAGRGRLGHVWHSPPGVSLHVSVVLRPRGPPARLSGLTLVVAVALAEAVERFLPGPAALRWPNDLFLGGKKAAGVLTELDAEGATVRHVIVGVGVNVNLEESALPAELRGQATSLRAARGGEPVDRAALLVELLARLRHRWEELLARGAGPALAEWRARASTLGATVDVWAVAASEATAPDFSGVAEDVEDDGALRVRLADGSARRVVAGEVRERTPARP
jgi:BirA family biotin operon repressor/biotin-[acetyl-CoA-carboxylase] ligase